MTPTDAAAAPGEDAVEEHPADDSGAEESATDEQPEDRSDEAEPTAEPTAEPSDEPVDEAPSEDADRAADVVRRIGVVVAAASALVAAYLWFAPTTVPANRGLPFGCGSPAHPNDQQLGAVLCGTTIGAQRTAAAVALAVAVLAVLVVLALRPPASHRFAPVALGVLAGLPLLGASLVQLIADVEVRSSDGANVFSCGSAVRPVGDVFARGICADVPGSRLAAGIALAVGGVLAIVAVPFVWRRSRSGEGGAT